MDNLEERFDAIQSGLPRLWEQLRNPKMPRVAVAVPSLSLDLEGLTMPGGLLHFEERMLYLFHLLSQPACHLWIYTSHLISEQEIAYFLHFLRHVPFTHARQRLRMQPLLDRQPKPLTQKMLERPALLERLRRALRKGPPAYLTVYHSSELEMRLAVELGIPIMGTDPRHEPLSTKARARELFESVGLQVAPGVTGLTSLEDLAEALVKMQQEGLLTVQQPRVVLKQNRGVSGLGNRVLSVMSVWNLLVSDTEPREKAARLAQSLRRNWSDAEGRAFWERFERLGGIVEAWVPGEPVSVQLSISPLGVEVEGVCEEIMDAKGRYQGAILPAADGLAGQTLGPARQVAEALARRGVLGRVEVDFLVGSAGVFPLDINFRKSNTQAALRQLTALAGGRYHPEDNRYRNGSGNERTMFTSDRLQVGSQASSPHDVIDLATEGGLHYSSASQCGVVFHMLGGVSATSRVGASCIGVGLDDARSLFSQCEECLGQTPALVG
jgi:hypothetical protein